jgi:epsilon-lactone hydrolase
MLLFVGDRLGYEILAPIGAGGRSDSHSKESPSMKLLAGMASSLAALTVLCFAQQPAERTIPARTIPVPTTVSPELQKLIAPAWGGSTSPMKLTSDEWKTLQKRMDEGAAKTLQPIKQNLHVSVQEEKIAGVKVYRVKPEAIAPENRNRLLVHVHGGAYVFFAGEAAASEAVLMAKFGKIEVVSVDYRMPPDFPFPAALDDALVVWKEIGRSRDPKTLGLFGTSTGGGLTLALVLKLKERHHGGHSVVRHDENR